MSQVRSLKTLEGMVREMAGALYFQRRVTRGHGAEQGQRTPKPSIRVMGLATRDSGLFPTLWS